VCQIASSSSPQRWWTSSILSADLQMPLQLQSKDAPQGFPACVFHSQSENGSHNLAINNMNLMTHKEEIHFWYPNHHLTLQQSKWEMTKFTSHYRELAFPMEKTSLVSWWKKKLFMLRAKACKQRYVWLIAWKVMMRKQETLLESWIQIYSFWYGTESQSHVLPIAKEVCQG